jgi:L-lactate dehydrogenase complex protein LldG
VDREAFLGMVGRASLTSVLPAVPPSSSTLAELPPADLLTLFRARSQAVNAVVHGPMSGHGVPRSVAGIAAGHGSRSFLAWDSLPVPGVAAALQSAGIDRVDHDVPVEDRLEHQVGYHQVDVGVTGAHAALAESGSIVLVHGEGRPRLASLIPEVHIVLLDLDVLERNLAHWAQKNPTLAGDTTNLVLITGPSRTGDIEQQLNLGVHGPRHLHIVMIR